MSWRYIRVGDTEWQYHTTPTLRCPYDHPRGAGFTRLLAPAAFQAAAEQLGLDAQRLLDSAHRRGEGFEDGRCNACGAEPVRLGFGARKVDVSRPFAEIVERHMFPLRKEAKAWVVEQAEVARRASREARVAR
jgi:hypothetical protein